MNKLLTHKGGQPVYLEDLDFIQKSIGDALETVAYALTDQGDMDVPIVLSGLDKFGTYGVNAGVIAYGGRIYNVPSHQNKNDGLFFLRFYTKSGEPRKLKNGSTANVYKYDVAEWSNEGFEREDLHWINEELTRRLWQSIRNRIDEDAVVYSDPAISSDFPNVGGIMTRTSGGGYLFKGELFSGDQYVGEDPYWEPAETLVVDADLPAQTRYVPLSGGSRIIPGRITTSHNSIKVEFWTEQATPGLYNFTVIL